MIETSAQRLESIRSSSQQPRPRLGCPVVETEHLKLFLPLYHETLSLRVVECMQV